METYWVVTENRGGDEQKPRRRKDSESVTGGQKKKKMDCRKVQLQEEEMETGCVGGSRPKAQREFVGTRIATRLQVRSEIVGKNALIFAKGVSSYGQKKFRKEGEDFLKKNDSSTHVKRQTLRRKIRDNSSYDLFSGLKLNEKGQIFSNGLGLGGEIGDQIPNKWPGKQSGG